MKETLKLMAVLTCVCMISGFCLSGVNKITMAARAEQDRQEALKAVNLVLPDHDNEPSEDIVEIEGAKFFLSRSGGQINGIAFEVSSDKGYSGVIRSYVGVDLDGTVIGVNVIKQTETPGLGTKITEPDFLAQYAGKNLGNANWTVKKEGGDFDQITGATISPKALTSSIKEGLEKFETLKPQLIGG